MTKPAAHGHSKHHRQKWPTEIVERARTLYDEEQPKGARRRGYVTISKILYKEFKLDISAWTLRDWLTYRTR